MIRSSIYSEVSLTIRSAYIYYWRQLYTYEISWNPIIRNEACIKLFHEIGWNKYFTVYPRQNYVNNKINNSIRSIRSKKILFPDYAHTVQNSSFYIQRKLYFIQRNIFVFKEDFITFRETFSYSKWFFYI